MPQTNPKRTWYPVAATGGLFTVIRLTTFAKFVEIIEDPAMNLGVAQGLQYNALDPFALSSNITLNSEPTAPTVGLAAGNFAPSPAVAGTSVSFPQLTFGDKHNIHSGTEAPLGNPGSAGNVDSPGGTATLGTPIVQLLSATATATGVIVSEWS